MHALQHRFAETRVFYEGEEPEVSSCNFMNFWRKITSDGAITIYVPRSFQRAAPRPLIRHYVEKAALLVSVERNHTLCDIRICRSSYRNKYGGIPIPCSACPPWKSKALLKNIIKKYWLVDDLRHINRVSRTICDLGIMHENVCQINRNSITNHVGCLKMVSEHFSNLWSTPVT